MGSRGIGYQHGILTDDDRVVPSGGIVVSGDGKVARIPACRSYDGGRPALWDEGEASNAGRA